MRQEIVALARDLLPPGTGRVVAMENLHITLVFLGALNAAAWQCVEQVAAGMRGEPFSMVLDRFGYWPKPRVLWLGSSQVADALLLLVQALQTGVVACGVTADNRPYQPHVTLLRDARRLPALEVRPITWHAKSFCLVESVSGPNGVSYRVLRSWDLA